jgi:nucleoside-diphosphate-sugar epimerase
VNIFVAGATGAIGRPLVRLLAADGHLVTGTTRSAAGAEGLRRLGARPAIVDVFDAAALAFAVGQARPEAVIHQLTDLADIGVPDRAAAALAANARIRIAGTANLIAAATAAGARRLVAQSIAFVYAEGPEPHGETDPLLPASDVSAGGVRALEAAVTGTAGLDGVVLRYGRLYGPGTPSAAAGGRAPLHVDAAAHAALLAVTRGAPGIYNIAEDDGAVSIAKARGELGFDPSFRLGP